MKKTGLLLIALFSTVQLIWAFGGNDTGTNNGIMTELQTPPALRNSNASVSTFTGTGNWSTSGNWSDGIPGSTTDATIAGTCTVDGDYTVTNLTINSGAVLTIDPLKSLTVSGTLTNNAGITGLVLSSDATGTAQLLNNSAGVQATVQQYIVKDQWHFMGIPVSYVADVDDVFHNCYVLWVDESYAYGYGTTSDWQDLAAGDSLINLHGYAVQYDGASDTTVTFTGTLNTGTIDTVFDSENEGWNFISNPYPASMDWDASGGKTLTNSNDAYYLWNPDLESGAGAYGSYGSYISGGSTNGQTRYIPPMQGFFFEVWATEAGIEFTNSAKVLQSTATFAQATGVPSTGTGSSDKENIDYASATLRLSVTDDNLHFDETLIRVNPAATDQFDGHYDAAKLKAIYSKQPLLYSVVRGREYSINTLPALNGSSVIPLQVLVKSDGVQTLALKERRGLPLDTPLCLYDETGNLLANLNNGVCQFDGQSGTVKSFYLGLGNVQSQDIAALHATVARESAAINQVVMRSHMPDAFIVQQSVPVSSGSVKQ